MKKFTLIFLLLASTAMADEQWKLSDIRWAFDTDSVRLNVYSDGSFSGTAIKTGVQSWDTTLLAQTGRLTQAVYLIYYWGNATPIVWPHSRNLRFATAGTFPWTLVDAYFPAPADSAALYQYRDTTLIYADTNTAAPTDYIATLTATAGYLNVANVLIWYSGADSAVTWKWSWDLTDTGATTISLPGAPNVCRVEGTLFNPDGQKIWNALVTATRISGENASGTSNSVNVIVSGKPVYAVTDTSGYFSMYLVGTHEYADTTRGFYNIKAVTNPGQVEIFNIPRVWIPSGGVWNVADTVSNRNR